MIAQATLPYGPAFQPPHRSAVARAPPRPSNDRWPVPVAAAVPGGETASAKRQPKNIKKQTVQRWNNK